MKKLFCILLILITVSVSFGADTTVDAGTGQYQHILTGSKWLVWYDTDTAYVFYNATATDLAWRKTTDAGATWGSETIFESGVALNFSIWYDQWTPNDTGTRVHLAWIESNADDVIYRTVDLSTGTWGSEVVAHAGTSFPTIVNWTEHLVTITKSEGGNIYIGGYGDADGEYFFVKGNADPATSFSAKTTTGLIETSYPADRLQFYPGNEVDTDDIWCLFEDESANRFTIKVYDQSANSWSEGSTDITVGENSSFNTGDASVRHSDGHLIVALWDLHNNASGNLEVWDITDKDTFTQKTNIVTGDAVYSSMVAVLINQNNDDIYVAYGDGATTGNVLYASSDDGGATWSSGNTYSEGTADDLKSVSAGTSIGTSGGRFMPAFWNHDLFDVLVNETYDIELLGVINFQVNISDVWKNAIGMQVNIGDVWKTVVGAWINIGDTWKQIF